MVAPSSPEKGCVGFAGAVTIAAMSHDKDEWRARVRLCEPPVV